MKTLKLAIVAALALGATAIATPGFATDGRTAVGKCIDTSGCTWTVFDDGSITIVTGGGSVIECPSATAECKVLTIKAPKTASGVGLGDAAKVSGAATR